MIEAQKEPEKMRNHEEWEERERERESWVQPNLVCTLQPEDLRRLLTEKKRIWENPDDEFVRMTKKKQVPSSLFSSLLPSSVSSSSSEWLSLSLSLFLFSWENKIEKQKRDKKRFL